MINEFMNSDSSSPLILAIETSQACCSLAIRAGDILVSEEQAQRQHAQLLLPAVSDLLNRAAVSVQQLDAIAFSRGPGSFTGSRIAASVAQGLAFGGELPVIPVSSLASLAHSQISSAQWEHDVAQQQTVCTVVDAHMGELYLGAYRCGLNTAEAIIEDCLLAPEAAARRLADSVSDSATWLTGNGLDKLMPIAESGTEVAVLLEHCQQSDRQASARSVLLLAEQAWQHGEHVPAEQAIPVYLRGRTAWKTEAMRASNRTQAKPQ